MPQPKRKPSNPNFDKWCSGFRSFYGKDGTLYYIPKERFDAISRLVNDAISKQPITK